MEPVSKTDLVALRAQKKLLEKNAFIADRVKEIYNYVTSQARDSDTKHCQWCFDRFSNLAEFPTTNDEVVIQLETLFPDCKIKYNKPTPFVTYIGPTGPSGEIVTEDTNAPDYITVDWD